MQRMLTSQDNLLPPPNCPTSEVLNTSHLLCLVSHIPPCAAAVSPTLLLLQYGTAPSLTLPVPSYSASHPLHVFRWQCTLPDATM